MFFILYNAGSGGDMVSAVIDSTDYKVTSIDVTAEPRSDRFLFKMNIINSHTKGLFCNDLLVSKNKETGLLEKSELFKTLDKKYKSLTTGHDFTVACWAPLLESELILIDDSEYKYTKWCMNRCSHIAPTHHPVFSEDQYQQRTTRIKFAKTFSNVKVIDFKDILEGKLITVLQQWIDTPLNDDIYQHWLSTVISRLPPVE